MEKSIRGEQSQITGEGNSLRATAGIQLAIDVAGMFLYGANGDDEFIRNGLI